MENERLVRIKCRDGTVIEFTRDETKTVRVTHEGTEITLPKATGITTTQLFALLEPMGETIIEEEDND
jgi:actin-like ATPase involved in cell morphogenesis